MIPFATLCPEIAVREVRCIIVGPVIDSNADSGIVPDNYAFFEYYCDDLKCDCRRAYLQVRAEGQPDKIFASINVGWESEAFYRKRMPWDPDAARGILRGELDPINKQSEFAEEFLDLFHRLILDVPYRMRLRRHYRLFREELEARRPPTPTY